MRPRIATGDDVPELVRLINAAYRVEDFFINGNRTNDRDVASRLAAPGACILVIDGTAPGDLAGAVYVEIRGSRGYFGLLSVDPGRQKQGLGRALVAAAEGHCRAAGCREMDLDVVNLRQELPGFYGSLGYTAAGTAPFPDRAKLTQEAHLVVMTKPLARA